MKDVVFSGRSVSANASDIHPVTHALRLLADVCCRRRLLQEDAEALRRDAGQTRSGAHLVRAHHREGHHRASVRPRRGTETAAEADCALKYNNNLFSCSLDSLCSICTPSFIFNIFLKYNISDDFQDFFTSLSLIASRNE